MLIRQLFFPWMTIPSEIDREISNLVIDSRKVVKENLFIALSGSQTEGTDYIQQAIEAGAIAILREGREAKYWSENNIICISLPDLKNLYGLVAARFYGDPSRKIKVIGITGTNGKTSSAYYLATLLNQLNCPCAFMGTIGQGSLTALESSFNTTADAVTIQRFLSKMLDRGFQYVAMEVSSHALDQGRVKGVEFYGAIYTNLTQDHLDYHGTMEVYAEAKAKLFLDFKPTISVFNADDEEVRKVLDSCISDGRKNSPPEEGWQPKADGVVEILPLIRPSGTFSHKWEKGSIEGNYKICTYSLSSDAPHTAFDLSLSAKIISYTQSGMTALLDLPSAKQEITIPLIGDFNLSNVLGVLTLLFAMGKGDIAITQLSSLKAVAGRMQLISTEKKASVVIDYAHTPDALEKVLKVLKHYTPTKLWCVFGCGGDRDKTKRPLMAAIASRYADEIILTDDNFRFENPELIMQDLVAGIPEGCLYQVIHDRRAAIQAALLQASSEDLILLAGKGHETYQEIKGERTYFSDIEEVEKILKEPPSALRAPSPTSGRRDV